MDDDNGSDVKDGYFQQSSTFAGVTMSRSNQFWLVIIVGFVIFVAFETCMTIGGALLSQGGERPHLLGAKQNPSAPIEAGSSAQSGGALTFSGQWQINTNADNGTTIGIMEISQNGTDFVGRGKDQLGNGSSALCSYKGTLDKVRRSSDVEILRDKRSSHRSNGLGPADQFRRSI